MSIAAALLRGSTRRVPKSRTLEILGDTEAALKRFDAAQRSYRAAQARLHRRRSRVAQRLRYKRATALVHLQSNKAAEPKHEDPTALFERVVLDDPHARRSLSSLIRLRAAAGQKAKIRSLCVKLIALGRSRQAVTCVGLAAKAKALTPPETTHLQLRALAVAPTLQSTTVARLISRWPALGLKLRAVRICSRNPSAFRVAPISRWRGPKALGLANSVLQLLSRSEKSQRGQCLERAAALGCLHAHLLAKRGRPLEKLCPHSEVIARLGESLARSPIKLKRYVDLLYTAKGFQYDAFRRQHGRGITRRIARSLFYLHLALARIYGRRYLPRGQRRWERASYHVCAMRKMWRRAGGVRGRYPRAQLEAGTGRPVSNATCRRLGFYHTLRGYF